MTPWPDCMRWRGSLLLVTSRRLRSNAPTGGGWLWSLMSGDCVSRPWACNAGYWEDCKQLTVCDEAILNQFWLDNKKVWAKLCLMTFSTWSTPPVLPFTLLLVWALCVSWRCFSVCSLVSFLTFFAPIHCHFFCVQMSAMPLIPLSTRSVNCYTLVYNSW